VISTEIKAHKYDAIFPIKCIYIYDTILPAIKDTARFLNERYGYVKNTQPVMGHYGLLDDYIA